MTVSNQGSHTSNSDIPENVPVVTIKALNDDGHTNLFLSGIKKSLIVLSDENKDSLLFALSEANKLGSKNAGRAVIRYQLNEDDQNPVYSDYVSYVSIPGKPKEGKNNELVFSNVGTIDLLKMKDVETKQVMIGNNPVDVQVAVGLESHLDYRDPLSLPADEKASMDKEILEFRRVVDAIISVLNAQNSKVVNPEAAALERMKKQVLDHDPIVALHIVFDSFCRLKMNSLNASKIVDLLLSKANDHVEYFSFMNKLVEEYGFGALQAGNKALFDLSQDIRKENNRVMEIQALLEQKAKQEAGLARIEKELRKKAPEIFGDEDGDIVAELEKKVNALDAPENVIKKAKKELAALKRSNPQGGEYGKIIEYLELVTDLPWNKKNELKNDIAAAKEILDESHYGLDRVKEAIIESLAVQKRTGSGKATIICLDGPPGVGKTSIGKAVAAATGRDYIRMSMGGKSDESDIRGHRRTYVGALPGEIIKKIKEAGSSNPLFMLDELEKMTRGGSHGDPIAAMLEVLDPEQNFAFNDSFLELPYDLSDVMFVATTNYINQMEPALKDRMEIIHIDGYTEAEKLEIAKRYLVTKQIEEKGLRDGEFAIEDDAIRKIIGEYTPEAGVRNLEKAIGKLARKTVVKIEKGEIESVVIKADMLESDDWLGNRKPSRVKVPEKPTVGRLNGMYFSEAGGGIMHIICTSHSSIGESEGKRSHSLNFENMTIDSFGAVMSVVNEGLDQTVVNDALFKKIKEEFPDVKDKNAAKEAFRKKWRQGMDMRVEIVSDSKVDGPSAGVAMVTAFYSRMYGCPVDNTVSFTGKVDGDGKVLPIGGVEQKFAGAIRAGVKTVIVPEGNRANIDKLSDEIKSQVKIILVSDIQQALRNSLIGIDKYIKWDDVPPAKVYGQDEAANDNDKSVEAPVAKKDAAGLTKDFDAAAVQTSEEKVVGKPHYKLGVRKPSLS